MEIKRCEIHPDVEPRVVVYCPACRGSEGGKRTAKTMTAKQKSERGKKAARARWKKKSGK